MKKYAYMVKVPKTPKSAYDHDRSISSLIEFQVKHLRDAEKSLPKHHQTNIDIKTLDTERKASEYIQKVTAKLHPQGVQKAPIAKKAAKKKKASKPRAHTKSKKSKARRRKGR